MDLGLKGKVAVITGGSRGIGAGIARELAEEGCALVLAARASQDLANTEAMCRDLGARVLSYSSDLRDKDAATALVGAAVAEFGQVDFLVACASSSKMGDFLRLTDDDWRDGFALKFFGHVRLIRALWPQLQISKGAIVLLAGAAGRTPVPEGILTGSINSALLGLTKALAARGIREGVRVNAINPGAVRTDRYKRRLRAKADLLGTSEAEAEQHIVAEHAVRRIGEPEDIAAMVSFLLSPRGSYMQGAIIDMDGGKNKSI